MNTNSKKSRKSILLLIGALLVLGFLCFELIVPNREPGPTHVDTFRYGERRAHLMTVSDFLPSASETNGPELVAEELATSEKAFGNEINTGLSGTLPFSKPTFIAAIGPGSGNFAVVDVERLVARQKSGADSNDAKQGVLEKITEIIAARAAEHHFAIVFDLSAKGPNNVPFVLVTNGVPDITEEVEQLLSPWTGALK